MQCSKLQQSVAFGKPRVAQTPLSQKISQRRYRASVSRLSAQANEVVAVDITGSQWESCVLEADVPVIVDFWAPWCGPCRIIMPLMDEIQKEYGDKVKVYKVNTDDDPNIATEYGIRSIPTMMIFKGGKKMETIIGAVPKASVTTALNKYMD